MAKIASILASTQNPFFCLRVPPSPGSRSVVFYRYLEPCGRRIRSIPRFIRACQPPDKIGGDKGISASAKRYHFGKELLSFASDNFLPLALVSGVGLGFANPALGCLADKYSLSKFSTCGIFIISGLTLRTEAIGAAVKGWPFGVFGLVSILLLTPSFSRLIMLVQLQPQELVTGLGIFCCMPTTLSSGVALTHVLSLIYFQIKYYVHNCYSCILHRLYQIANSACWGKFCSCSCGDCGIQLVRHFDYSVLGIKIYSRGSRGFFSYRPTLQKSYSYSLNPFNHWQGFANFVDNNRILFSRMNAICLSLVPWIQVSRSRSLLLSVKPKVFLAAVGIGILLHLSLLAFNALSIRILSGVSGNGSKNSKANATAVLLVASQKTLPVMVTVVEQLRGAFGEPGLLVLPCVAAHLNQIMIDSILVNLWLRKSNASSTDVKTA